MYDDIKILVVDSNEESLWLSNRNLEHVIAKPNIFVMNNGKAAYDFIVESKDIDIVMLDRFMPGMNGLEIFMRLKEKPEFKHTHVIFQTGRSSAEELDQVIESGCYMLLRKPYDLTEMNTVVDVLVRKIRRLRRFKEMAKNITRQILTTQEFFISNFVEAEKLAVFIAFSMEDDCFLAEAIYALLENAIEHGNLGILDQKAALLKAGTYDEEIAKRQSETDKQVRVFLFHSIEQTICRIEDNGNGFNPMPFFTMDQDRLLSYQGRGILTAILKLNEINFLGVGNKLSFAL